MLLTGMHRWSLKKAAMNSPKVASSVMSLTCCCHSFDQNSSALSIFAASIINSSLSNLATQCYPILHPSRTVMTFRELKRHEFLFSHFTQQYAMVFFYHQFHMIFSPSSEQSLASSRRSLARLETLVVCYPTQIWIFYVRRKKSILSCLLPHTSQTPIH